MIRKTIVLVATAVAVAGIGVQVVGAQAPRVRHYANCTALHRDYAHGVARTRAAANAEVADGYGRPHVSRRLYLANSDLDANHDRVACEA